MWTFPIDLTIAPRHSLPIFQPSLDFSPHHHMPVCAFFYRHSPCPLVRKRGGREEDEKACTFNFETHFRCKIFCLVFFKYLQRSRCQELMKETQRCTVIPHASRDMELRWNSIAQRVHTRAFLRPTLNSSQDDEKHPKEVFQFKVQGCL